MDDDAFYNALDMEGSDGHAMDEGNKTESTGRWTREEHLLFIKGLELYGKGWKKIAGLIKTRTVVQIRTHAQKYFLKLSKARQNGESGGNLSMDGKALGIGGRKKHRRKNSSNANIALAAPLIPFVKANGVDNSIDIDDGLYNFLSPVLPVTRGDKAFPTHTDNDPWNQNNREPRNCASATDAKKRGVKIEGRNSEGAPFSDSNGAAPVPPVCDKPQWFQRGLNVDSLLRDAEKLDWMLDSGTSCIDEDGETKTLYPNSSPVPVPLSMSVPSTLTSSGSSSSSVSGETSDCASVPGEYSKPGNLFVHGGKRSSSSGGASGEMPRGKQGRNSQGGVGGGTRAGVPAPTNGRANGHSVGGSTGVHRGGYTASDVPMRASLPKKATTKAPAKGKVTSTVASSSSFSPLKGAGVKAGSGTDGMSSYSRATAKNMTDSQNSRNIDFSMPVGADRRAPGYSKQERVPMVQEERRDPLHDAIDEHMRSFTVPSGMGSMGSMGMSGMPSMAPMGDFEEPYGSYDRDDHDIMHGSSRRMGGIGMNGMNSMSSMNMDIGRVDMRFANRTSSEPDMKMGEDREADMRSQYFLYSSTANDMPNVGISSPLQLQAFSADGGDDMGIALGFGSSGASADDADIDMFATHMDSTS
jgi:SHAQKYF class myb-like DNA-binding protein